MSIARRAATLIAALCTLSVNVVAQVRLPEGRTPITRGPIQPAPRPAPPPTSSPAPAPPPAVATPPVARGISGLEIVYGPTVDVAPLTIASTSAQCPSGKVALSAAVDFRAPAENTAGLEILGAWPDNQVGTVKVRNANVGVRATARALAVCAALPTGLRQLSVSTPLELDRSPMASKPIRMATPCALSERVIGGGVMGRENTVIASNAPDAAEGWLLHTDRAHPYAIGTGADARVLCAPVNALDGWEVLTSPEVSLGGKSQTTLSISCPNGKGLLAAGVQQRSNNLLDMIVDNIVVTGNMHASAHVQNRNIVGSNGNVRAVLTGVCVRLI